MLKQGLLMVDYDKVKELNDFLKVLSNACKQLTNNIGWEMANGIHDYVFDTAKGFTYLCIMQ